MKEDLVTRAKIKRNEYLLKTEQLFIENKNIWFADFTRHFQDIIAKIQECQDKSSLPSISYLEYIMLYTNFINRQYVAEIFVFNNKSYLDKSQSCIAKYDVSFLFSYFDKLWDDLLNLKRRYLGKVSWYDVTSFMLNTLPDFFSYLAVIIRHAIAECADNCLLTNIGKEERFAINVGDYMAKTETVYEERKNKDAKVLSAWFSKRLYSTYTFGDYSNLDFSGRVFMFTDFRFARFNSSNLYGTNFEGSSLIGTIFRNANMDSGIFDHCLIYEADFSNTTLKNASFRNAKTKVGVLHEGEWDFVGFLPTNFRYANLTGADFNGANLTGADFTGAVLKNTDFTNAIFDNTIFDKNDK
ncbi:MAG: pentapeptide repeat-containing protein [Oscillospiraceae bacterium]|nr:pentapeptide repeat-containing protein [Oscillospiraceae bacterium]